MFRGTMLQQIKWNVQEKTELNFPGRDMAELNLIESSHDEEDGADEANRTTGDRADEDCGRQK